VCATTSVAPASNVGVFGRVGYADGNLEPCEFTDVDRTASLGASFGGEVWDRPHIPLE
jgi:high affinity Mn2+ porin